MLMRLCRWLAGRPAPRPDPPRWVVIDTGNCTHHCLRCGRREPFGYRGEVVLATGELAHLSAAARELLFEAYHFSREHEGCTP